MLYNGTIFYGDGIFHHDNGKRLYEDEVASRTLRLFKPLVEPI